MSKALNWTCLDETEEEGTGLSLNVEVGNRSCHGIERREYWEADVARKRKRRILGR